MRTHQVLPRSTKAFTIIVATDAKNGIGKNGEIPWKCKEDLNFFQTTTTKAPSEKINAVIMGRKTFESIPLRFRPLSGRMNFVLTRQERNSLYDGANWRSGLESALLEASHSPDIHQIFVIGGGEIYKEALKHVSCERILWTKIHGVFDCDVFFPIQEGEWKPSQVLLEREYDPSFQIIEYIRQ